MVLWHFGLMAVVLRPIVEPFHHEELGTGIEAEGGRAEWVGAEVAVCYLDSFLMAKNQKGAPGSILFGHLSKRRRVGAGRGGFSWECREG
jgi:hypothetical protein